MLPQFLTLFCLLAVQGNLTSIKLKSWDDVLLECMEFILFWCCCGLYIKRWMTELRWVLLIKYYLALNNVCQVNGFSNSGETEVVQIFYVITKCANFRFKFGGKNNSSQSEPGGRQLRGESGGGPVQGLPHQGSGEAQALPQHTRQVHSGRLWSPQL